MCVLSAQLRSLGKTVSVLTCAATAMRNRFPVRFVRPSSVFGQSSPLIGKATVARRDSLAWSVPRNSVGKNISNLTDAPIALRSRSRVNYARLNTRPRLVSLCTCAPIRVKNLTRVQFAPPASLRNAIATSTCGAIQGRNRTRAPNVLPNSLRRVT